MQKKGEKREIVNTTNCSAEVSLSLSLSLLTTHLEDSSQ